MKEPLDSHRQLSPPADIVSKAPFFTAFAGVMVGVLLVVGGLVSWRLEWTLLGLGVGGVAWAARSWLQRNEPGCAENLDAVWDGAPEPDEARVAQLVSLLEQWETMEEKRGAPDFDPWTLQALRNEIRQVVESDPALEALFDRLRQTA